MLEVELGELAPSELGQAAQMLGRAFRDNPLSVAVFRGGEGRRRAALEGLFVARLPTMGWPPICARRNGWVVGVAGLAPPGTCRLGPWRLLRLGRAIALGGGLGALARALRVVALWERWDPKERHWHLGPVGVEPAVQGMAVGSQMLERFCAYMDALGELAYLETDKPENVRFYQRFGFRVIGEEAVLGVVNWFMVREPCR